jgi:hypothetical protein
MFRIVIDVLIYHSHKLIDLKNQISGKCIRYAHLRNPYFSKFCSGHFLKTVNLKKKNLRGGGRKSGAQRVNHVMWFELALDPIQQSDFVLTVPAHQYFAYSHS